ncbi:sugar transferase [Alphaproteobacteria bacterium GH1-50]|uniref:Sugar transferase n=1 Tax=Kangsaoukella pontilimi TaxID=2691042 RepID=A0A7C9MTT0_9RHOB|nr:sugar transferase [Kangsaoukella pontilimi]MXQ06420.1 sugar transferase [Kangsaoukella pontilimi]
MTVHVTNVSDRIAANVDSIPIESVSPTRGIYRAALKRVFDVTLVLLALPFVLPFLALVALAVATDGHSPIFAQERVGKDGRRFTLWKFRTMVPDAEEKLDRYLAENEAARREWTVKQKLTNDPRCTRFGLALRRTSIDELPQIFNVLVGDMSLVGPRPMMPSQQSMYPGRAYYKLRPGITGLWQVSPRNQSDFADRAHYDDVYHARLSFPADAMILAKTLVAVVRGTGC